MKVLLVDDDDDVMLEALEKAIRRNGYEVELAKNGDEGWERFQKGNHPVVVTDLWMPESLDGLDLLEKIRKQNSLTQVIIITGHGGKDDAIRALNLEAFRYIEKGSSEMSRDLSDAIRLAFERCEEEGGDTDFTSLLSNPEKRSSIEKIRELAKEIPVVL